MITLGLCSLAGAFGWTFTEYALHAWHGHRARGRNEFSRQHLKHHAQSGYFAPLDLKLRMAIPIGLATLALAIWVGPLAIAAWAGFFGAYTFYEVLHYRLHVATPIGAYGRWARRHHFFHHFGDARTNHGVTTPLWDVVFQTLAEPRPIQVPRKFVMPWLVDGSGNVRPEHAGTFSLGR